MGSTVTILCAPVTQTEMCVCECVCDFNLCAVTALNACNLLDILHESLLQSIVDTSNYAQYGTMNGKVSECSQIESKQKLPAFEAEHVNAMGN